MQNLFFPGASFSTKKTINGSQELLKRSCGVLWFCSTTYYCYEKSLDKFKLGSWRFNKQILWKIIEKTGWSSKLYKKIFQICKKKLLHMSTQRKDLSFFIQTGHFKMLEFIQNHWTLRNCFYPVDFCMKLQYYQLQDYFYNAAVSLNYNAVIYKLSSEFSFVSHKFFFSMFQQFSARLTLNIVLRWTKNIRFYHHSTVTPNTQWQCFQVDNALRIFCRTLEISTQKSKTTFFLPFHFHDTNKKSLPIRFPISVHCRFYTQY